MDSEGIKEVYFDKYCKSCEHSNKSEDESPCYECLDEAYNVNSHKPVKYMERFSKGSKK